MYDLFSHITRVNSKLTNCEDGIPLTEEDIEKFGLEEDLSNMHRKYAKIGVLRGKNSFKEMPDKEETEVTIVDTDMGEIKVYQSSLTHQILDMEIDEKQNDSQENIDGEIVDETSWIDTNFAEKDFQWFSAKILKDDLLKIKTSESKQPGVVKSKPKQEEAKIITPPIRNELERGEIPTRGRGMRGVRGSRGNVLMPVETHESNRMANQQKCNSESNSDMMSDSKSRNSVEENEKDNDIIKQNDVPNELSSKINDIVSVSIKSNSKSGSGKIQSNSSSSSSGSSNVSNSNSSSSSGSSSDSSDNSHHSRSSSHHSRSSSQQSDKSSSSSSLSIQEN